MSPVGWRGLLDAIAFPEGVRERVETRMEAYKLTPLQREIVALHLAGYATKEICAEMRISQNTFFSRQRDLAKKLDVSGTDRIVIVLTILGIGVPR